jgi:signal peptidase I
MADPAATWQPPGEGSGGGDGAHGPGRRGPTPGTRLAVLVVLSALFAAAGTAAVTLQVVFDAHILRGESMAPTYGAGDRILTRPADAGDLRRGDVVLVDPPGGHLPAESRSIVRVVALGGDEVDRRGGRLVVDGEPVDEPYLAAGMATEDVEPVEVPDGHVYVLGDNRINARDSRAYGPLPAGDVVATVASDRSLDRWALWTTVALGLAVAGGALWIRAGRRTDRAGRADRRAGRRGLGDRLSAAAAAAQPVADQAGESPAATSPPDAGTAAPPTPDSAPGPEAGSEAGWGSRPTGLG